MYIPMVDSVSILLQDSGVPVDTKTAEKPFVSIFSTHNFNMIVLFIWIPMLWVYGHYKYFNLSVRGSTLKNEFCMSSTNMTNRWRFNFNVKYICNGIKKIQNSIKIKKNIKSVCIFYHIKSISEPGVTAVQLKPARPGFIPLKHDAWSFSFASSSGIKT